MSAPSRATPVSPICSFFVSLLFCFEMLWVTVLVRHGCPRTVFESLKVEYGPWTTRCSSLLYGTVPNVILAGLNFAVKLLFLFLLLSAGYLLCCFVIVFRIWWLDRL